MFEVGWREKAGGSAEVLLLFDVVVAIGGQGAMSPNLGFLAPKQIKMRLYQHWQSKHSGNVLSGGRPLWKDHIVRGAKYICT